MSIPLNHGLVNTTISPLAIGNVSTAASGSGFGHRHGQSVPLQVVQAEARIPPNLVDHRGLRNSKKLGMICICVAPCSEDDELDRARQVKQA